MSLLRFEVLMFLGALYFTVFVKLLSGRINLTGLLWQVDPKTGQRTFSPGRVQLLTMTLFAAGDYLLQVIAHPKVLPDMPSQLILLQGASGATFLLGKYQTIFRNYFN